MPALSVAAVDRRLTPKLQVCNLRAAKTPQELPLISSALIVSIPAFAVNRKGTELIDALVHETPSKAKPDFHKHGANEH